MTFQKKISIFIIFFFSCWMTQYSYASFIETTIGTAVVNDATAAYFNPAALVLLPNPQIIPLITFSEFRTRFTGRSTSVATKFTTVGSANTSSNFLSPSFYFGIPLHSNVVFGLAAVSNLANRNLEENSILRYIDTRNSIQDFDLVTSLGVKINEYFSIGAGVNFSNLNFNLRPIIGFPGTNLPDSESNNQTKGKGIGGNAGFILKPSPCTLVGFNYRSSTTYANHGKSILNAEETLVSNNLSFKLHTPAHSVLSIAQQINPSVGLITTVQRLQWKTKNIHINNLATIVGGKARIINASVPFHLHDTWLVTVGGSYQLQSSWIIRAAATYNQSPQNGHYQMSTGNSFIVGASISYKINKIIALDASYAHAFIKDMKINIHGARFLIQGKNQAARDAISLKMIVNIMV